MLVINTAAVMHRFVHSYTKLQRLDYGNGFVHWDSVWVHPFIKQYISRQVRSLFQSELSTYCNFELPPSNESILFFP
jgi:hypothetical protein